MYILHQHSTLLGGGGGGGGRGERGQWQNPKSRSLLRASSFFGGGGGGAGEREWLCKTRADTHRHPFKYQTISDYKQQQVVAVIGF